MDRLVRRLLPFGRRLIKRCHPEAIPWPGSVLYNKFSANPIFQFHYGLIVKDIARYCPQGLLLDAGTGPGRLLLHLHAADPRLALVGVDLSEAMIVKARENIAQADLGGDIKLGVANAAALPFPAATFDAAVTSGAVHHFKHPQGCYQEFCRVLKPGGHALMYDLVTDIPEENIEALKHRFGKLPLTLFWLHSFEEPFYTTAGFRQLAASAPLQEVETHFIGALYGLILRK